MLRSGTYKTGDCLGEFTQPNQVSLVKWLSQEYGNIRHFRDWGLLGRVDATYSTFSLSTVLTNDENGLDDDVDDDGPLLALALLDGDRVVGIVGDDIGVLLGERVGVGPVGVDLDDAAPADDVQVGADLVVAVDCMADKMGFARSLKMLSKFLGLQRQPACPQAAGHPRQRSLSIPQIGACMRKNLS